MKSLCHAEQNPLHLYPADYLNYPYMDLESLKAVDFTVPVLYFIHHRLPVFTFHLVHIHHKSFYLIQNAHLCIHKCDIRSFFPILLPPTCSFPLQLFQMLLSPLLNSFPNTQKTGFCHLLCILRGTSWANAILLCRNIIGKNLSQSVSGVHRPA